MGKGKKKEREGKDRREEKRNYTALIIFEEGLCIPALHRVKQMLSPVLSVRDKEPHPPSAMWRETHNPPFLYLFLSSAKQTPGVCSH